MVTTIKKWGNSQGLQLTKTVLQDAGIDVGDRVLVSVRKGRILIEPLAKVRGKHNLKQLVSRMRKKHRAEDLDWGAPVGREAW